MSLWTIWSICVICFAFWVVGWMDDGSFIWERSVLRFGLESGIFLMGFSNIVGLDILEFFVVGKVMGVNLGWAHMLAFRGGLWSGIVWASSTGRGLGFVVGTWRGWPEVLVRLGGEFDKVCGLVRVGSVCGLDKVYGLVRPSGSLLISLYSSMFSNQLSLHFFNPPPPAQPSLTDVIVVLGRVSGIHGPYTGESGLTSDIIVSSLHW